MEANNNNLSVRSDLNNNRVDKLQVKLSKAQASRIVGALIVSPLKSIVSIGQIVIGLILKLNAYINDKKYTPIESAVRYMEANHHIEAGMNHLLLSGLNLLTLGFLTYKVSDTGHQLDNRFIKIVDYELLDLAETFEQNMIPKNTRNEKTPPITDQITPMPKENWIEKYRAF